MMANKIRYKRKEVVELLNKKYPGKTICDTNSPSMGRYRIDTTWYDTLAEIIDRLHLEDTIK